MTDKVNSLPADRFVALWNAAGSLAEATEAVRAVVGPPCPRWAVLARATALRAAGEAVKPVAGERRAG